MNIDRLKVLAAFIRGQAQLTDKHPHTPGPGSVNLNHEEALICADALEDSARFRFMARDVASGDFGYGSPEETDEMVARLREDCDWKMKEGF